MKPSIVRYIQTSHYVWSLLWRIMPKACKEVQQANLKKKILVKYGKEQQTKIQIK